ncbi:hypothetical protein DFH09DRAFT_1270886 [Mycena vulgaris]|nr:hypothetical protein DFH09DRAFT_1270886 [Mycena vulgaris]
MAISLRDVRRVHGAPARRGMHAYSRGVDYQDEEGTTQGARQTQPEIRARGNRAGVAGLLFCIRGLVTGRYDHRPPREQWACRRNMSMAIVAVAHRDAEWAIARMGARDALPGGFGNRDPMACTWRRDVTNRFRGFQQGLPEMSRVFEKLSSYDTGFCTGMNVMILNESLDPSWRVRSRRNSRNAQSQIKPD